MPVASWDLLKLETGPRFRGVIDVLIGAKVEGWAIGLAAPDAPAMLDFFLYDEQVLTVACNILRPDIAQFVPGSQFVGFSADLGDASEPLRQRVLQRLQQADPALLDIPQILRVEVRGTGLWLPFARDFTIINHEVLLTRLAEGNPPARPAMGHPARMAPSALPDTGDTPPARGRPPGARRTAPRPTPDAGTAIPARRRASVTCDEAGPDLSGEPRAYIEGGFCASDGSGGLVFGWAIHDPGAQVHLVSGADTVVPLSACFRRTRQDIVSAFPNSKWAHLPSAFIAFIPNLTCTSDVRLIAGPADSGLVIAQRSAFDSVDGGPVDLARQIFCIDTPPEQFAERTLLADWPLLSRSIAKRRRRAHVTPSVIRIGAQVKSPQVSLIIPLFGRTEFMEPQIMEFARDPFLRDRCEVIYVVDDPPLWPLVEAQARAACALFGMSVTLITDMANNGFSGANNLGARAAVGDVLLFLNSDVIPVAPGWAAAMVATLSAAPDIGAVGPRLIYPDGGIQHAGMAFRFLSALRIWINTHPGKGFAAELDTGPETEDVAAVTGACLALRRAHFDLIGGWDEGYLIGDFEDSHLCLALRDLGLRIVYHRGIELVHLERQSFGQLGSADFRHRVVLANAARHQHLWAHILGPQAVPA